MLASVRVLRGGAFRGLRTRQTAQIFAAHTYVTAGPHAATGRLDAVRYNMAKQCFWKREYALAGQKRESAESVKLSTPARLQSRLRRPRPYAP